MVKEFPLVSINKFNCRTLFVHFMTEELYQIVTRINFTRASVCLQSDHIILVQIRTNDEVELYQAKEITGAIAQLAEGVKHPVLILPDKFSIPTSEVWEFLASPESVPYTSAEAYILSSFSQKLAGNIYLSLNRPVRPTLFFNSEEKAVEWLKSFL